MHSTRRSARRWHRHLPFGAYVSDRWERVKALSFGAESSIDNAAVVLGKISVGEQFGLVLSRCLTAPEGADDWNGCSIAANNLVLKDVPAGSKAFGTPCKVIGPA